MVGLIIFIIAALSMILTSISVGIILPGLIRTFRHFVSSDFLLGKRRFPWSDKDGG